MIVLAKAALTLILLTWQMGFNSAFKGLNKNEALFTRKLDVNLRQKAVKRYIWSITWILELGHCRR